MNTALLPRNRLLAARVRSLSKLTLQTDRFVFFRLALGLMVLYKYLSIGPYWNAFFSESGLLSPEILALNNNPGLFSWHLWCDQLSLITGWTSADISSGFYSLTICAGVAFTIGLFSRLSAVLLLLVNASLTATFSEYSYGVDHFLTSLLAYAVLFPLGRPFSADHLLWAFGRRIQWVFFKGIPGEWAMAALRIHLCIVYFIGGLTKLGGPTWWNGEAVWKAMHRPGNEMAFLLADAMPVRELYIILGISTILVELLYPALIWWRRSRTMWLWLTLGMHLFIGIILELHLFATCMIVFNLLAFGQFASKSSSPDILHQQTRSS
jgi:uncharacterized membrane protein YphA (DoxX/SURF4 family)